MSGGWHLYQLYQAEGLVIRLVFFVVPIATVDRIAPSTIAGSPYRVDLATRTPISFGPERPPAVGASEELGHGCTSTFHAEDQPRRAPRIPRACMSYLLRLPVQTRYHFRPAGLVGALQATAQWCSVMFF